MAEEFSVFEYAQYLRERWKFAVIALAVAGVLSGAISLLLPKRYTAMAVLMIEAPAGSDPRSATSVSPVYLESLKTYEQFAAGDSLFVQAAERFHLRDDSGSSIDSLKRSVLKVVKPRDTRLLQISVTLRDPVKAQAVAQFIAEESAKLNRAIGRQADDEFLLDARKQVDAAEAHLEQAERAWAEVEKKHPADSLYSETSALIELRTRLQRDLADARADAADNHLDTRQPDRADTRQPDRENAGARAASLQKEIEGLDRKIALNEAATAERRSLADPAEFELRAARSVRDTAIARMNDLRAAVGIRGERLRVIDPGIVPQRPSSPNIPLNILAALFIAAVGSLVIGTVAFVVRQEARPAPVRVAYR
jgi:capsular polysaccharide biosynthesis protein